MNKKEQKIILIIEDDKVLLKTLEVKFTKENYKIMTAIDGEEAVKNTIKEKPDLIILDLLLPKMNGLQVLATIKMMDELKNIPVLVLSNLGDKETIKEAKKLGVLYYYVKAEVDLSEVLKKVKDIFSARKK